MAEETAEQKAERERKEKEAAAQRPPAITPKVEAEDAPDLIDRIIHRYGNERAALAVLADENFQYRTRHREDTTLIERMTPLTLTKEQKADYDKYVALGKPDELKTRVEKVPTLEAQVAEMNQRSLFLEIGQAEGMKPNVLQDLSKTKGFTVELRTEKVDGEDKKVAYAKGSGKDDQFIKLSEYAEKHLTDYIPSLKAEDASESTTGSTVLPFPRQPQPTAKGKAPATGDAAQSYLASTYKTPAQEAEAGRK